MNQILNPLTPCSIRPGPGSMGRASPQPLDHPILSLGLMWVDIPACMSSCLTANIPENGLEGEAWAPEVFTALKCLFQ